MAPIRRRRGTTNNEDNDTTLSGHHYHPDPLNTTLESEKEMRERIDRLKTHFQNPEVDMHRRLPQVSSGEGSSQSLATRVQAQLTTCLNCNTLPATMVCYPCRHLCDTKVSECPLCKNIKLSSFMPNQSST